MINASLLTNNKPIGILTCQGLDEYKNQDISLIQSLKKSGYLSESVVWNHPHMDWNRYCAIVVCSTWDYFISPSQLNGFLSTLRKIHSACIPLFNSYQTIAWNCKKTYLKEVAEKGFYTIESVWLTKDNLTELPSLLKSKNWTKAVIKPVLSGGALHTMAFTRDQAEAIVKHCETLNVDEWMVQPFVSEIITEGEYSFIFLNNQFSHCVLKKPLENNFLTGRNHTSNNVSVNPSNEMLAQAQKIINIFAKNNLATRLDVIRRNESLIIMEIEMIEPYLYGEHTTDFGDKYASAVVEKLKSAGLNLAVKL